MSEDIRKYKSIPDWFKDSVDLSLTAVVGGEKLGVD
jgi:hypothetical protein